MPVHDDEPDEDAVPTLWRARATSEDSMTNVEKYTEALAERAAIERAIEEEGSTPQRIRALQDAKARVVNTHRHLTGGDMGKLRRMGVKA